MTHHTPHHLIGLVVDLAAALAPSAIGATVAVAMKRGLTWTERLLQILIGICVSWYARGLVDWAVGGIDAFAGQSIGFVAGLIAYDALPKVKEKTMGRVLDALDAILAWLPGRREGK